MKDFSWVYWLHILFVGPLFIYVGLTKQNVSDAVFNFLVVLGVAVVIYHSYKLYLYKNPSI
jgi:hypothetical protein